MRINPLSEPPLDILLQADVFRQPLQRAYEEIGLSAARREYYFQRGSEEKAAIDIFVSLWRDIFRDYATNYAYRIENELNETSKEEIRKALKKGYEEALSGDKLITRIRKSVGNEISRFRASLIARTEATTAASLGKEEGARSYFNETNQGGYQQWITRIDGKERHTHHELNGNVISMAENWTVGTETARFPGDVNLSGKERIQCRCTRLFMSDALRNRLIARGEL